MELVGAGKGGRRRGRKRGGGEKRGDGKEKRQEKQADRKKRKKGGMEAGGEIFKIFLFVPPTLHNMVSCLLSQFPECFRLRLTTPTPFSVH